MGRAYRGVAQERIENDTARDIVSCAYLVQITTYYDVTEEDTFKTAPAFLGTKLVHGNCAKLLVRPM